MDDNCAKKYTFHIENLEGTYAEIEPIYRRHYGEMAARLEADGIATSPYRPRLDSYFRAAREGYLLHFVARCEGQAVGYCNVYLTNDMHCGDLIAREDLIYVLPEHRGRVGKQLVRFGLDQLRQRSVKRLLVTALTDLRVAKLWKRMGFQPLAEMMVYQF